MKHMANFLINNNFINDIIFAVENLFLTFIYHYFCEMVFLKPDLNQKSPLVFIIQIENQYQSYYKIKNMNLSHLVIYLLVLLIQQSFTAVLPLSPINPKSMNSSTNKNAKGLSKQIRLFQSPQYAGYLKLFTQIPQASLAKFIKQTYMGVYRPEPQGYDYAKNFTNWGDTVELVYDHILYPIDYAPIGGKQITSIQQLVRKAAQQGKRVRGAGLRHSWSNIFSDPEQYLVSFFPSVVVYGTSQVCDIHALKMDMLEQSMAKLNIQHLNQIKKVGEIQVQTQNNQNLTKHLVKIGSGVSNQQLRKWSNRNKYQLKSNVIMVEINFVGALCTCSHGAGKNTQTLCDYVNQIEFIDSNGNRQTISKKDNPKLLKSAASALGLLGIVIFVTVEMQDLQIVKLIPKVVYKDFAIPWPKNYPNEKKQQRMQRPEYQQWLKGQNSSTISNLYSQEKNFGNFIKAINRDYCQWFYFPLQGTTIFQNTFEIYKKNTAENIATIKTQDSQGVYIDHFPVQSIQARSQITPFLLTILSRDQQTLPFVAVLLRNPFVFFPKENIYTNYPDAIHFQHGIQNAEVRNFQCQINIPLILTNGQIKIDYDLMQKIWWTTMDIVENQPLVNIALQMRVFKGSNATLAPQFGFDYVCSIEVIRTSILDANTEKLWKNIAAKMFNAWKALTDSNGKQVTLRPHWGKEWDHFPQVKQHLLQDEGFKQNLRTFLKDYKEIAALKNFSYERNLFTFSNKVYRELLNSAIEKDQLKVK